MAVPNARRLLAEAWERLSVEQHEELRALAMESWRECLSASKDRLVKGFAFECRGCGKRQLVDVPMEVPDVLTRARAFEVLARESFGAVPDRLEVSAEVGERTLAALEALSTAELARIAGVDVVDGELLGLESGEG